MLSFTNKDTLKTFHIVFMSSLRTVNLIFWPLSVWVGSSLATFKLGIISKNII
jgi:hypothetical protein